MNDGWIARALLGLLVVMSIVCGNAATARAGSRVLDLSGKGADPQLAVDRRGDAHIVWTTDSDGTDTITYCEIPDRGRKCAITHTFPLPPYSRGTDRIVLGPATGEVVVIGDTAGFPGASNSEDEGDGMAVWVSMDAGSEGGGYLLPPGLTEPDFSRGSNPAFGPGDTVSMLDDDGYFEDFPVDAGPSPGPEAVPAVSEDTELFSDHCSGHASTSVATVSPTRPIAACEAGSPGRPTALEYRVATGRGDPNDASTGSWAAVGSFPIGGSSAEDFDDLAGGPAGVFANYQSPRGDLAVRRLSGAGTGPQKIVASAARPFDFSQDAVGNLYAAYFHDIDQGAPLAVSTSEDGSAWTTVPIATPGLDVPPEDAQVGGCAAATAKQSGNGWVVWSPGANPNGKVLAESFGDGPCGAVRR